MENQIISADSQILSEATKKAAAAAIKLSKSLDEAATFVARAVPHTSEIETTGSKMVQMSREISKKMSDQLRMAASNAGGQYRDGQRMSWNRQYDELTEKMMGQNPQISEAEARSYARSQMAAEAKYKLDMKNPRKKAKMDKAEDWGLQRMARGGADFLDGVTKMRPGQARPWESDRFKTKGLGLSPHVSPVQARAANGGQPPAQGLQASGMLETVRSILTEIQYIGKSVSTISII